MKRFIEIKRHGCIKVRSIVPVQISRNVRIWEIDMDSKYVDVSVANRYNGEIEVLLDKNENTMHLDESELSTVIHLPIRGKWSIIVDSSKYTVIVVAYRE